jgi:glutaredoxin-like protein
MGIIPESHIPQLKSDLAKALVNPVTLTVFTQEIECQYCRETREIAEELSSLNNKIRLQVFDLLKDKEKTSEYRVDKVPAIVVEGSKKSKANFYGAPAGYEFSTLVKDIVQASRRETTLSAETKKMLSTIKTPVHLQVFVTPTCPYCPGMVSLAHQFAMENENIKADMIEVTEFPQLPVKYNVSGVPKTVINETVELVGVQPEQALAHQVHGQNPELPPMFLEA